MRSLVRSFAVVGLGFGCSASGTPGSAQDAGHDADAEVGTRDPTEAGDSAACPTQPRIADSPTASNIKHVVIVVQENHSFDNYFAFYCTAPTGSKPACHTGPACCETAPLADPGSGDAPVTENDAENGNFDPDILQACEIVEIDDGKMDKYVTAGTVAGNVCGSADNFAYANEATVKTYWALAGANALADTYFQSIAGASASNDMYLATAGYVFTDDDYEPDAIGAKCEFAPVMSFTGTTIGDLLVQADVPWGWYSEGYAAMVAAQKLGKCPSGGATCPFAFYPCVYDPNDVPFEYFPQFTDNPTYMFDYARLACDVTAGALPAVSYVKPIGYRSEHPGLGDTISAGEAFVTDVIGTVEASAYAKDTLILVTWDESGGFFDHVSPPTASAVDGKPYGPRIPLLAVGPFAKKNYVSHVPMEHASIVKFIEWNWLGRKTGQLGHRDAVVNDIGDLLDPAATGVDVPAD